MLQMHFCSIPYSYIFCLLYEKTPSSVMPAA